MTSRARLVAGLFVLMSVGLAIFGVTMYKLYSGSQYRQLRHDLKNAVPLVTQELANKAGVDLPKSITGPGSGDAPNSGYGSNSGYRPGDGGYSPRTTWSTARRTDGTTRTAPATAEAPCRAGRLREARRRPTGAHLSWWLPVLTANYWVNQGSPVTHVQLENSTAVPAYPGCALGREQRGAVCAPGFGQRFYGLARGHRPASRQRRPGCGRLADR